MEQSDVNPRICRVYLTTKLNDGREFLTTLCDQYYQARIKLMINKMVQENPNNISINVNDSFVQFVKSAVYHKKQIPPKSPCLE